ncbi:Ubiquitin fusion degradation protein 4 [Linnemannia schmuckeri]|uniref:HECT-type E3 ubiquitin transferase n=1 Tax=Linnemannia schmuckeri TaxID=64567 RepID=A0A9P5RXN0_9FUNG|nr:Ubiquitin fusion degradation protein 4 [Linnemannia schmuckeri]
MDSVLKRKWSTTDDQPLRFPRATSSPTTVDRRTRKEHECKRRKHEPARMRPKSTWSTYWRHTRNNSSLPWDPRSTAPSSCAFYFLTVRTSTWLLDLLASPCPSSPSTAFTTPRLPSPLTAFTTPCLPSSPVSLRNTPQAQSGKCGYNTLSLRNEREPQPRPHRFPLSWGPYSWKAYWRRARKNPRTNACAPFDPCVKIDIGRFSSSVPVVTPASSTSANPLSPPTLVQAAPSPSPMDIDTPTTAITLHTSSIATVTGGSTTATTVGLTAKSPSAPIQQSAPAAGPPTCVFPMKPNLSALTRTAVHTPRDAFEFIVSSAPRSTSFTLSPRFRGSRNTSTKSATSQPESLEKSKIAPTNATSASTPASDLTSSSSLTSALQPTNSASNATILHSAQVSKQAQQNHIAFSPGVDGALTTPALTDSAVVSRSSFGSRKHISAITKQFTRTNPSQGHTTRSRSHYLSTCPASNRHFKKQTASKAQPSSTTPSSPAQPDAAYSQPGAPGSPDRDSDKVSGISLRLKGILINLRVYEDPSLQLIALHDLVDLLSASDAGSLAGAISCEAVVKELVFLMRGTGGDIDNPKVMLLACQCLSTMMEVIPASLEIVVNVGGVSVLCSKLAGIQYVDLAEQSLEALQRISPDYLPVIIKNGGFAAVLQFLETFSTRITRKTIASALQMATSCCNGLTQDRIAMVKGVQPKLLKLLHNADGEIIEQACLCFVRLIDRYKLNEENIQSIVTKDVLRAVMTLLSRSGNTVLSPRAYSLLLQLLRTAAEHSPRIGVAILQMNLAETLAVALGHSQEDQVIEIISVLSQLLPESPQDDVTEPKSEESTIHFLSAHPDVTCQLGNVFISKLMQICMSKAPLDSRELALGTLFQIIHYCKDRDLEVMLRNIDFAKFLASMLSFKEDEMIIHIAIKLVGDLMAKIPRIYHPIFKATGVVAALTSIARPRR